MKSNININNIPAYSGNDYIVLNNNVPNFSDSDLTTTSFEEYSPLDNLGRCGVAYANIGTDLMPTEGRESISSVKPSGWQSIKYDIVEGKYLYNRSHLIGFQLTAENANKNNLITGTRYFNATLMLPYENMVADYVKELGGKAFVTDCNTLYVGGRKNALDHLDSAYSNGYNPFQTGVHTIIADGLKGTDEEIVPINGEYVKEAKIGQAIMDADIIISLNHFKGHELTGFGGALKNLGMGCGSRAGKMEMHCDGKPSVDTDKCVGCGACSRICAHSAPIITDRKCYIDPDKCLGCGRCIGACHFDAIKPTNWNAEDLLNRRMAEYAYAILNGRPHFHINIITDVSPNCDCHGENDMPIVPNLGMVASFDPVAVDQASADIVNEAPVIAGSELADNILKDSIEAAKHDHFHNTHPNTNWHVCLEHAEKIGLGTCEYELVKI